MLAVLHVEDVWQPDRRAEAKTVFNSTSLVHPGVNHLLNKQNPWYVGGRIEGLQSPAHYDFKDLRLTPAELRIEFARLGWRRVAAFQTRNPMHRAHVELTLRAAKQVEANLLLHPSVGITKLATSITSHGFGAINSSLRNTRMGRQNSHFYRLRCVWADRGKRFGTP